jgi:hypothetical protein
MHPSPLDGCAAICIRRCRHGRFDHGRHHRSGQTPNLSLHTLLGRSSGRFLELSPPGFLCSSLSHIRCLALLDERLQLGHTDS